MDARVARCLPLAPDALAAGCAGFRFGLGDDAAVVDGAALGLRLGFGLTGDDWGLVVRAERLLPRGVVGSWGARPAVDRKSTRLNSSHIPLSRMPSSA